MSMVKILGCEALNLEVGIRFRHLLKIFIFFRA